MFTNSCIEVLNLNVYNSEFSILITTEDKLLYNPAANN
jgi:hypothetical protein